MASYCETCEKIFDGKWDNCPECGNVTNELSSTNVKIEKPDKSKKSTKETIPLPHKTDNISSNRDNNRTHIHKSNAQGKPWLSEWEVLLEKDKQKNPHLFLIADHLWWLAFMVQISLVMMVLSIIGTILLGF